MGLKHAAQRLIAVAAISSSPFLFAASPQNKQPDNTTVNKTEKPTADQATNKTLDRDQMQKIRQAIMADKSLSTYAHNVKVISKNGKVTLKGVVHSDDEKRAIESKATEVAGSGNVVNDLTVKKEK